MVEVIGTDGGMAGATLIMDVGEGTITGILFSLPITSPTY